MTADQPIHRPDIRYVTIEPGRISLHGVALTDGEYAVLRGIAERMKRVTSTDGHGNLVDLQEKLEC